MNQKVTYDWPEGGGDPFDTDVDETCWVLLAGRQFGRMWPAGDMRDFGRWGDFERRVPMGYKVIQVAERLAVVERGRVLREWPETRLQLSVEQQSSASFSEVWRPPFTVVDGQPPTRGANGRWVEHDHDSYRDAMAEALALRDRTALVVRVLRTENWH